MKRGHSHSGKSVAEVKDSVLRRVFGLQKAEVTLAWRIFPNKTFHNL